jgi:hypothetical protein
MIFFPLKGAVSQDTALILLNNSLNLHFSCSHLWFLYLNFVQFTLKLVQLFLCPSINCFLICLILPKAARALKLSYFSLERIFKVPNAVMKEGFLKSAHSHMNRSLKVAADGIKNPRKIVNHSGLWKLVHVE